MADLTEPTLEELLAAARRSYLTALESGKAITFNGRTYNSHDLEDLERTISRLEALVGTAGAGAAGAWSQVAAYCKGV